MSRWPWTAVARERPAMHPILFHLPLGLPVHAYGTMLLLGMAAGGSLAVALGRRDGFRLDFLLPCLACTLGSALAGARLLAVLVAPEEIARASDVVSVWRGGVVAYGGFLGGLAGSAALCRVRKVGLLAWADCAAPGVCVGLALTRVGCLLAGCDFGKPWGGPWAVAFPPGSPAFEEQWLAGLIPRDASGSLPVHPTQVYESLLGVVLLAVALTLWRRRRFRGQVFLVVVVGYGLARASLEMLRGDAGRGGVGPFSTSQLVGIGTAALGLVMLRSLSRRAPRPPARPDEAATKRPLGPDRKARRSPPAIPPRRPGSTGRARPDALQPESLRGRAPPTSRSR